MQLAPWLLRGSNPLGFEISNKLRQFFARLRWPLSLHLYRRLYLFTVSWRSSLRFVRSAWPP
jgi:hypothetical protein